MKQDNKSLKDTANYMLICKIANRVFSQWEGKVVDTGKKISLISNNMLGDKRIECEVSVSLLNSEKYPFAVDGNEKTCCILGGCGCPCENEKEVEERLENTLKRYQFKQKE